MFEPREITYGKQLGVRMIAQSYSLQSPHMNLTGCEGPMELSISVLLYLEPFDFIEARRSRGMSLLLDVRRIFRRFGRHARHRFVYQRLNLTSSTTDPSNTVLGMGRDPKYPRYMRQGSQKRGLGGTSHLMYSGDSPAISRM